MMSNKRTAPPMIIRRRRRGFTAAVGSEGCATGFDGSGEIFEVSTVRFSVGSDESGAVGSFICLLLVHICYSAFRKQMFHENVRQSCLASCVDSVPRACKNCSPRRRLKRGPPACNVPRYLF